MPKQSHTEVTRLHTELRGGKSSGPRGSDGFHNGLLHPIEKPQTVELLQFTESEHLGCGWRLHSVVLEVEQAVRGIDRHAHPLQGQHLLEGMVAYQTAHLKANHPVEFLSAMTHIDGDAELRDDPTPGRLSP